MNRKFIPIYSPTISNVLNLTCLDRALLVATLFILVMKKERERKARIHNAYYRLQKLLSKFKSLITSRFTFYFKFEIRINLIYVRLIDLNECEETLI